MVMDHLEHDIKYICRNHGVKGYDQNDLAQELRFELLKRIPNYDCYRAGIRTWANKIMRNKIKNLVRDSNRAKRKIQYYINPLSENDKDTA